MKNLKPFNLQAALSGKAVMLRDGTKAYVRHHETEFHVADNMLVGYDTDGFCLAWCENGYYYAANEPSDSDIIGMHPETRVINGFEVPAPETVPLDEGANYYLANPLTRTFYSSERWQNTAADRRWLERGLVHLSVEGAVATAKAMPGIDLCEGDEL